VCCYDAQPISLFECQFDRVCQALARVRFDRQPVYHDLDVVFLVAFEVRHFVNLVELPVNTDPDVATAFGFDQQFLVLALAGAYQRGEDDEVGALG
jgi:hypothetical protein